MRWQRLAGVISVLGLVLVVLFGCQGTGGGSTVAPEDTTNNEPPDAETVVVPEGVFIRGTDYPQSDESPARNITLDQFFISKTEVTNEQFATFLNDGNGNYYDGNMQIGDSAGVFWPYQGWGNHPVVYVDYDAATAYATWAGGRLPTEAEWEKAARGTDARIYPWGNEWFDGYADVGRGDDASTQAVGLIPEGASPYGALDMGGSVWEWCSDWYDPLYYASTINYSPNVNPTGPPGPVDLYYVRVIRGGSFVQSSLEARCSNRYYATPNTREMDLGFRVAWNG